MAGERDGLRRVTFIVRLDRDPLGRITGVIERVRTGEKTRVDDLADVGEALAALLAGDQAAPPSGRPLPGGTETGRAKAAPSGGA